MRSNPCFSTSTKLYTLQGGCSLGLAALLIVLIFSMGASLASDKSSPSPYAGQVFINEICAKNTAFINGNGWTPDIIELYNAGNEDVSLAGWYFTIRGERHDLPARAVIDEGGFLVVLCDERMTERRQDFHISEINVAFDIPADGTRGGISLYDAQGLFVDTVIWPPLAENRSWARVEDGGDIWAKSHMTPGESNQTLPTASTDGNRHVSDIESKAYVREGAFAPYEGYPIISLIMDPEDLYDDEKGIFTNYEQVGQERRAHFTYISEDGADIVEHTVGVRVRGQTTRGRNPKSMTIRTRTAYDGHEFFGYSFFADGVASKRVILKHREPSYKDGFLQSLVTDRSVGIADYQVVQLFLNGEYYGEYALQQRFDEEYFSYHYDVEADTVFAIKTGDNKVWAGNLSGREQFFEFRQFLWNTDFQVDENYQLLLSLLDIQSYADTVAARAYWADHDFNALRKNTVVWRSSSAGDDAYGDGRWRWALHDLDAALEAYDTNVFTLFAGGRVSYAPFFNNLLQNADFKELFINTFLDMADNNFAADSVIEKLHREHGPNSQIEEFFTHRREFAIAQMYDYIENLDAYVAAGRRIMDMGADEKDDGQDVAIYSYMELLMAAIAIACFPLFIVLMYRADRISRKLTKKSKYVYNGTSAVVK